MEAFHLWSQKKMGWLKRPNKEDSGGKKISILHVVSFGVTKNILPAPWTGSLKGQKVLPFSVSVSHTAHTRPTPCKESADTTSRVHADRAEASGMGLRCCLD